MEHVEKLIQDEFSALSPNFFNSAYFGPIPKRAQAAGIRTIERAANPGNFPYEEWRTVPDLMRGKIAKLLRVSQENISHHGSTSEVISFVSLGFPTRGGSVVLMEGEYPSDVLPWMVNEKRSGYKIVKLKEESFRDIDLLRKNLPADAKVLNISHVMFNTGRCNDILAIGKLCQERGIFFIVDVSQSLGGVELSQNQIEVCDVIVGATYKWMLGPYGHAFAYWSPRALKEVAHVHLSWHNSVNSSQAGNLLNYTMETTPGARRFDRGQAPNMIGMSLLAGSLDLHAEVTLAWSERHNRQLVNRFLESYPKTHYKMITPIGEHANIVCLRQNSGDGAANLETRLRSKKIEASVREGNLRLAFHLFNTPDQVDHLVKALT